MTKEIFIPRSALVLMVGGTGSGKTHFAQHHFPKGSVLSSDDFRFLVSGHEAADATEDAFDVMSVAIRSRLLRRLLTVVDATNLRQSAREALYQLARECYAPVVAITMMTPLNKCKRYNAIRHNPRPERVVVQHYHLAQDARKLLLKEGVPFHPIYPKDSVRLVVTYNVEDRRDDIGPFDIIGDIHGCFAELMLLVETLGYHVEERLRGGRPSYFITHPNGRKLVFVGDIVDRGPENVRSMIFVMDAVSQGHYAVRGNHDARLLRWLDNQDDFSNVFGFCVTKEQFECAYREYGARFFGDVARHIRSLPSYLWLDGGRLVVSHAGIQEDMIGGSGDYVDDFCVYGQKTLDDERLFWMYDYHGSVYNVYGHFSVKEPHWIQKTLCVDNGCVYGGRLTALQWPSQNIVSQPALETWFESSMIELEPKKDWFLKEDVSRFLTHTMLSRDVQVSKDSIQNAYSSMVGAMSFFPWMVCIPPSMGAADSSYQEGYLEHPASAFEMYRKEGVKEASIQAKYMGSRGITVIKRTDEEGVFPKGPGVMLTKSGHPMFSDNQRMDGFIRELRRAVTDAGLWDIFGDYVVFDGELMPWSEKGQRLIQGSFMASYEAYDALQKAVCKEIDVYRERGLNAFTSPFAERDSDIDAFGKECRKYIDEDDAYYVPFMIITSERKAYWDVPHAEQLALLDKMVSPLIKPVSHRTCVLEDAQSCQEAVLFWESLIKDGEGVVIKAKTVAETIPLKVPPMVKIRGPEYLRLVYGPSYQNDLNELRKRNIKGRNTLVKHATIAMMVAVETLKETLDQRFHVLLASKALTHYFDDVKL